MLVEIACQDDLSHYMLIVDRLWLCVPSLVVGLQVLMRVQIRGVILMLPLVAIIKGEVVDGPIQHDIREVGEEVTHEMKGGRLEKLHFI